jgi:hypothetical protein
MDATPEQRQNWRLCRSRTGPTAARTIVAAVEDLVAVRDTPCNAGRLPGQDLKAEWRFFATFLALPDKGGQKASPLDSQTPDLQLPSDSAAFEPVSSLSTHNP